MSIQGLQEKPVALSVTPGWAVKVSTFKGDEVFKPSTAIHTGETFHLVYLNGSICLFLLSANPFIIPGIFLQQNLDFVIKLSSYTILANLITLKP